MSDNSQLPEQSQTEAQPPLDVPAGSAWISVADRCPDSERQVLTWDRYSYGADTYDPIGGWVNACGSDIPHPITHWQDLPPPPNIAGQTPRAKPEGCL